MRCFESKKSAAAEPQTRLAYKWWRSTSTDALASSETNAKASREFSQENTLDSSSYEDGDGQGGRGQLTQSGSQRPHDSRVFTYAELKTATRNFHRGNLLGEGGFGCVYKGVIRDSENDQKMDVAVKQLNQKGVQGHKEWLAEVHFLGVVEHPNLVKLVGYCAEDDSRGSQRLLVYEFLSNKTLEAHLFSKNFPVLSWRTRVQIALGAAQGLAYLHEDMDFQVIFRDFKGSNILLDDGFNPKLSDFGLARQGPSGFNSHVTTAVVGTVGYAAPEYIQTGHLTAKSDVWSFGIVLLELLTGRKAMDRNKPKSEQRLLDWVRPYIREARKFSQLMDPRLDGVYPVKAAHKFAALASQCLQKYPRLRPKMSEVADTLETILKLSVEMSPRSVMTSPNAADDRRPRKKKKKATAVWSLLSLRGAILSIFSSGKETSWRKTW